MTSSSRIADLFHHLYMILVDKGYDYDEAESLASDWYHAIEVNGSVTLEEVLKTID